MPAADRIEACHAAARDAAWARLQHGAALADVRQPQCRAATFRGARTGRLAGGAARRLRGPWDLPRHAAGAGCPDRCRRRPPTPRSSIPSTSGRSLPARRGGGALSSCAATAARMAGRSPCACGWRAGEAHTAHRRSPELSAAERELLRAARRACAVGLDVQPVRVATHLRGARCRRPSAAARGARHPSAHRRRLPHRRFSNVVLTRPSAESIVQALTQSPPL